jgi:hypothetical protein
VVEFQAYSASLGLPLSLFNGNTLPDSSVLVGFDLQWDGTNVYFNMPASYPALYGHYFYLFAEFDDGVNPPYYLNVEKLGLTPFVTIPDFVYDELDTTIETQNQIKIVLPALTLTDFNNYVGSSLNVDTSYKFIDAYGYVGKRTNSILNVSAPFDWRGIVYRRFEVDLTAINPYIPVGYFGIGDNWLGQGTTGNFQDFLALPEPANIQWSGISIIDSNLSSMDNTVFFSANQMTAENSNFYDNTFTVVTQVSFGTVYATQNVVSDGLNISVVNGAFTSNLIDNIALSTFVGDCFSNNFRTVSASTIGAQVYNNNCRDINSTVIDGFFGSNGFTDITFCKFGTQCQGNNFSSVTNFNSSQIGSAFNSNTGTGTTFAYNVFGNGFSSNVMQNMSRCTFGNVINSNNFGSGFTDNIAGDNFYNNVFVGNSNSLNIFGEGFHDNTMSQFFFRNRFTRGTYLNTFGLIFAQNNFLETCFSNVIGNGFTGNTFLNRFESNNFGGNALDNAAKFNFVGNTIGDTFSQNNINQQFANSTVAANFNNVTVNADVVSVNFTLSTIVYQAGDKTIFTRSDNNQRISYVDATDTIVYNIITF